MLSPCKLVARKRFEQGFALRVLLMYGRMGISWALWGRKLDKTLPLG